MSAVATDRLHGPTAATEILVLEPVAQRLGLEPVLLMPGEITVGSSPDCQVQLPVPGVQAEHCVLTSVESRVSIRAVDRRTWLNNLPISQGWLRVGDRLAIGPVEFRVRLSGPRDFFPPVPAVTNSLTTDTAAAVSHAPPEQGRAKLLESQLLQEIAGLEAEVARQRSAVTKLEAAPPPAGPVVSTTSATTPVEEPPLERLPPRHEFARPQFHLRSSMPRGQDDQSVPLTEENQTQSRQVRLQLADLALRHAALNRQSLELTAQWDQLRGLIAEQEAATAERSQREEQLHEREIRCAFQESEIARRSEELSEKLDNTTARLQQLQAEADQLSEQSTQLTEREKSLSEFSHQMDLREAELEQLRVDLEQREAAERDAAEVTRSWQQLREATETRWALRAQELEKQASLQQSQAESLSQREFAVEEATAEIRQERQQMAHGRTQLESWSQELSQLQAELHRQQEEHATLQSRLQAREEELTQRENARQEAIASTQQDREHLAAELARLHTWNEELTRSQAVFTHQQQELAIEAASIKAEAQEFVLREHAWEQIVSITQRDQERLEAERSQLEALRNEVTAHQAALAERQQHLDSQEASHTLRADEVLQRQRDVDLGLATIQQDQERIAAEQQRLANWDSQLAARQSELDERLKDLALRITHHDEQTQELARRHQQLESQEASHKLRADELLQREQGLEQGIATIQQDEERIAAEEQRLANWNSQLAAKQSELDQRQQDLAAQTTRHDQQAQELTQREEKWQQDTAAAAEVQKQHQTERDRLEAWRDELSNWQVELDKAREEFQARQVEWAEECRIEADSTSAALTNEYCSLERTREELAQIRSQLEHGEVYLRDWDEELQDHNDELLARELALHDAEVEWLWKQRKAELTAATAPSASSKTEDDLMTDVAEQLRDERDSLAQELFFASQAAVETNKQTDQLIERLRLKAEQLTREVDIWQQQLAKMDEDHRVLLAIHQQLQEQEVARAAEQHRLETLWEAQQSQLTEERQLLQTKLAQLHSREAELASSQDGLQSERASLDQISLDLRQQHEELAEKNRDLEQRQRELERQVAEQSALMASHDADNYAVNRELADQRRTLDEEQARLNEARLELDRQRQEWERERQTWREQLESERQSSQPDSSRADILSTLSNLDELVQSELDYDNADGNPSPSAAFEEIPAEYPEPIAGIEVQAEVDAELDAEPDQALPADVVEPSLHETPHSLWADDTGSGATESVSTSNLPVTDDHLSVLDLRARLAEMFSLELSDIKSQETEKELSTDSDSESDAEDFDSADSSDSENFVSRSMPESEQSKRSEQQFSVDPAADEYDSVESYMQRLLDRNRRSRAGEETEEDRYTPNTNSFTTRPAITPVVPQPLSEFDDSVPEPVVESDPVAEPLPFLSIRGPVDTLKMRAGLDSLRQVANISARHAIARSKWKRMRTRIALQGVLTAGSFVVGIGILTGKYLGLVGTTLWGWLALAIGVALGCKLFIDIRWIYQGDRRSLRTMDAQSHLAATGPETPAALQPGNLSEESGDAVPGL